MMMRGLADPLVSAYCHLYLAHCARSLYLGDDGKKESANCHFLSFCVHFPNLMCVVRLLPLFLSKDLYIPAKITLLIILSHWSFSFQEYKLQ